MLKPMFGYRPKHKKFDLPFRYYDPEKDEKEKRKRRIHIKRINKRQPAQLRRVIAFAILLSFIIYLMTL